MLINESRATATSAAKTMGQRGAVQGSEGAAIAMYVILLISYILNSMDRQLFAILAVEVRKALDLSLQEVGYASTIFTLGMGVAGLPTAFLMSKLSRKNVSLIGLGIFSLATLMTAYSYDYPSLLFYRFMSGMGEAMQFTAILAIGTTFFNKNRAAATGALNFSFGLGALIGPNIGASILATHGWQMPFVAYGLAALPIAVLIMIAVRNWFTDAGAAATVTSATAIKSTGRVWSRSTVILALCSALAGLVMYGYIGLYPTYLRDALGFTPAQAAFAISFYGLGALISIIGGWCGDRFDHRKLLFVACIVAGVSGSLLFTPLFGSLTLHAGLSFLFGASVSGMVFVNLTAGVIKSVHPDRASLGAGILVASLYIPASFAGYLLAMLRNATDWTTAGALQVGVLAIVMGALALMTQRQPFPSAS